MTSKKDIVEMLRLRGEAKQRLHREACEIRDSRIGKKVFLRGLVEFSNACGRDCLYCGINRSNDSVKRYSMSVQDIAACVDEAYAVGYRSFVLQSGELRSEEFTSYVEEIVSAVMASHPSAGITLSCGEQSDETYIRWRDAGAKRYLLRIETSNRRHYEILHAKGADFDDRLRCLVALKELGYQVGSGVMIGSPHQTIEDLAGDILFLRDMDVDMVGMGPFVPHSNTAFGGFPAGELDLALNMIAVLRKTMPTINIASTTALETLKEKGRQLGLMASANVVMPTITPERFRGDYLLYDNKPVSSLDLAQILNVAVEGIESLGLEAALGESGDPLHFLERKNHG